MVEVIPAILSKTYSEVEEKIRKVEPYVSWVQLDIADGVFVPNVTWNNPKELRPEDFSIFLEAHLMVANPASKIDDWISAGVKRIIVHIEAVCTESNHKKEDLVQHEVIDMAKKAHEAGIEFGLALNPETPLNVIEKFLQHCDLVLLLGVSPGFSGQKFKEEVLQKIKELRKSAPNVKVEVDGGINLEIGRRCLEAGADILVVGSYIFGAKDVKKAIEELQKVIL